MQFVLVFFWLLIADHRLFSFLHASTQINLNNFFRGKKRKNDEGRHWSLKNSRRNYRRKNACLQSKISRDLFFIHLLTFFVGNKVKKVFRAFFATFVFLKTEATVRTQRTTSIIFGLYLQETQLPVIPLDNYSTPPGHRPSHKNKNKLPKNKKWTLNLFAQKYLFFDVIRVRKKVVNFWHKNIKKKLFSGVMVKDLAPKNSRQLNL